MRRHVKQLDFPPRWLRTRGSGVRISPGAPFFSMSWQLLSSSPPANAAKYSGQKHFKVHLKGNANQIELEVSDQGAGFDLESMQNGRGLGLVSMAERIHLLNGRISIDSKPNVGTTVRAWVPLATQPKAVTASAN